VISEPEVDLDREQERMAEAIPHLPSGQPAVTPATGLSLVGNEGVEDGGRGGGRSRQDHTATNSKPHKNTRFGEYFLGNTLGEGEFGKVKMGWKQEGGVQV
jgi:protein-serine/threonine kinase